GPAHADRRGRGRDDAGAAAAERGDAREAAAGVDADERYEAGETPPVVEGPAVEAGDGGAVGVARPAAAALGEEDDRQPQLRGQLEEAVLLPVVLDALRAGEHGVIVRHHDAARARLVEEVTVHPADPGDEPVRGRPLDQLLDRPPARS